MMQQEFKPGQRWLCEADPALGVGTVIDIDQRTVTINFKAAAETRTYALHNTPLTRVRFSPGDTIPTHSGKRVRVESVYESDGLLVYVCSDGKTHDIHQPETELADFIRLDRPADRLFTGKPDVDKWFRIRYLSHQHRSRQMASDLFGLVGTRTSLLPHQLYIAHEVAHRYAPRVMLADEVGLGKTIEAGLILHHQLLNERARRILIVVPENLLHQWLVEMLRRFNLFFSIFDQGRCQALADSGDYANPFHSEQLVLCSLDFLVAEPEWLRHACSADWDLLVVDEVHHLYWSAGGADPAYRAVAALAGVTRGVLLLTATPEQLGRESHFARLRLLDEDRFADFEAFLREQESYRDVAGAVAALLDNRPLTADDAQRIAGFLHEPEERRRLEIITQQTAGSTGFQEAREGLIESLIDRHGTGRILFRNTRATVHGFPFRHFSPEPLSLPDAYAGCLDAGKDRRRVPDLQFMLSPELLYQRQLVEPADWIGIDPRIEWLQHRLRALYPAKVLVITACADTALDIARALRTRSGIHAAVFHEGMSLIERDRAAAYFADEEAGSQVLISSEIGSEGRNFQFVHHLVLFDLPANPDLLEQRIGRLDRIGQTESIRIHLPYLGGSAQEQLFRWYHEGLDAFNQTCPAAYEVYVRQRDEMERILRRETPAGKAFEHLLQQTRTLRNSINESLKHGRDRLLEYNSCRPGTAATLKRRAEQFDTGAELQDYMEQVFDCFGVHAEEHSRGTFILSPGEGMLSHFPGLDDDGMSVTYSRETALVYEDRHFLTWEHPMVINAMDMILGSESGNAVVAAVEHPELEPGAIFLEILLILEAAPVSDISPQRFLPPEMVTLIMDERCRPVAGLNHEQLNQHAVPVAADIAGQVVAYKEATLRKMLEAGENLASGRAETLIAAARQRTVRMCSGEIERLRALHGINPNVRPEEINYFESWMQELERVLESAGPRLDALRVIVAT